LEITQSLVEEFITESLEKLDQIEIDLLELEKTMDNPQQDVIDSIFRGIHSIKGGAGIVRLNEISSFSHAMEDMLKLMRTREIQLSIDRIDLLLACCDIVKKMLNDTSQIDSIDKQPYYDRLVNIVNSHESHQKENEPTFEKNDKSSHANKNSPQIIHSENNDCIIIQPDNSLLDDSSQAFYKQIMQAINDQKPLIQIDLTHVKDIDPATLNLFLILSHKIKINQLRAKIHLIHVSKNLELLFKTMHLDNLFHPA